MEATNGFCVRMQILEYHVVPNQVLHAADFTQGEDLNTVLNQTVTVRIAHLPPFPQRHSSLRLCAGICEAGLEPPADAHAAQL